MYPGVSNVGLGERLPSGAVHSFLQHVFHVFLRLGGIGVFSLAVIDAILFTPLANDVLLVALISRDPSRVVYYVFMTVAGSTCGCWILDYFSRKGGEAGLKRAMSRKRIEFVKNKIAKKGGSLWLILASTLPPPFPFTAVVAGVAALQYPRKKLLAIVAVSRLFRFTVLGYLAYRLGRQILAIADEPAVRWSVTGIIVVSVVGSVWVVVQKLRENRYS